MATNSSTGLKIAVVGTGIAGLSAAWLLSRRHHVAVFEQSSRIGGHCHTVNVETPDGAIPVDTGFIVYNPPNYPNLAQLFTHLGVKTRPSDMSFAVSLGGGKLEYSGTSLATIFAQPANLLSPRFLSMLRDLHRFYRTAPKDLAALEQEPMALAEYLDRKQYGRAFRDDHLLPMAAAIWSAPAETMLAYPAESFIRFFDNHGLLAFRERSPWRTVVGGSRAYVARLTAGFADRIATDCRITGIKRDRSSVLVEDEHGRTSRFDHVVIATHGDEALALLSDAADDERRLLGAFRYTKNTAVLHNDPRLMPRRRSVWSSWNYVRAGTATSGAHITYWVNRLQGVDSDRPLFVTLNPPSPVDPASLIRTDVYAHPAFDVRATHAQRQLWSLQGQRNTWFCGAYFGAGFHEDALQAGLAVAEDLGGERRPWKLDNESSRIWRGSPRTLPLRELAR